MNTNNRLPVALFFLRLGIFVVMFIWTIDKFIRPEHSAAVFENFYFISGFSAVLSYVIGAVEMIIIAGFLLGYQKKWTYGAVLVLHGISTLSSFKQYLSPFEGPNLLFFAAWPMLAACFALYYLRDQDTLLVVKK
ncbi:MAG: hypothetical protein KAI96_07165 [Thermodesulfovibrionia bacterium]|nr:hypothetical protein [Thermodesulfovibrionia bacterium]